MGMAMKQCKGAHGDILSPVEMLSNLQGTGIGRELVLLQMYATVNSHVRFCSTHTIVNAGDSADRYLKIFEMPNSMRPTSNASSKYVHDPQCFWSVHVWLVANECGVTLTVNLAHIVAHIYLRISQDEQAA